ncbi:MAG TPA: TonB-dependent receptor [Chthoniobacteraceae bacterium]|nr:TonB-dependent receptor [Chthoniobacteraceae bacterium]
MKPLLILPLLISAPLYAQSTAQTSGSAAVMPEVDVVQKLNQARDSIVPARGATSYSIPASQIQVQSQGDNAPINQTILRAPGVAQDSFGQLHVRGEHNNLQFRIDGILLPEGITGFGQELDSRFIDNLSLIDGALPAQFGFKTAGIVDIQTKQGTENQGGTVNFYGGSDSHMEPSFQYGGANDKWTYYFEGDFTHDTLGIENPAPSDNAIHDTTNQYRAFGYLSYIIDDTSRVSFFGGASYQDYQIPDNPGQTPAFDDQGITNFNSADLNENQHQQNSYGVLAYQKSVDDFSVQAAFFERYSTVLFTPDEVGDLIFNGLAGTENHSLNSNGIQIDASYNLNEHHTIRFGLQATLAEQHADDPLEVFSADAAGDQTSDVPLSIHQGDYRAGWLYGFYLQDEWKIFPALTMNYGGRFDIVDEFTHENQLSPRLNFTLQATRDTTLHVGYAKYFTPPTFEAVTPRDVAATNNTTSAFAGQQDDPVRSERADYFDAGITQDVGSDLRLGMDAYYKEAANQIDSGQFGAAIIETEFNYKKGNVSGIEWTADYHHDGFSAYGNLALSKALGTDIDSQQFQFDPTEMEYIKNHWIYLDHNQAVTASVGIAYQWRNTRLYADLLYGNGLRAGFANLQKLSPYYPLNLGVEQKIPLGGNRAVKLRFDLVNLFDQVYELRAGTGVGVGAPQYGSRRAIYGGVGFDF